MAEKEWLVIDGEYWEYCKPEKKALEKAYEKAQELMKLKLIKLKDYVYGDEQNPKKEMEEMDLFRLLKSHIEQEIKTKNMSGLSGWRMHIYSRSQREKRKMYFGEYYESILEINNLPAMMRSTLLDMFIKEEIDPSDVCFWFYHEDLLHDPSANWRLY